MADEVVLRQSDLHGRLILDYETTNELGWVDDLLVDVNQAQVVGILVKESMWQRQTYSWSHIANIGADSIVLHRHGRELPTTAAQPMIGLEVWTDTGNCVGHIIDYRFERPGTLVQYLFTQTDQAGLYGLAPDAIISAGRKRLMVSDQAIEQAEYFANEVMPIDQPDWQVTAQTKAQTLANQVQQRAQDWSDYAQERWLNEDLNEQLQEQAQGLRSRLNQQVSKAQKRLRPLNKALENTLENTLDRFGDQKEAPPIDLDSFEVWEDD